MISSPQASPNPNPNPNPNPDPDPGPDPGPDPDPRPNPEPHPNQVWSTRQKVSAAATATLAAYDATLAYNREAQAGAWPVLQALPTMVYCFSTQASLRAKASVYCPGPPLAMLTMATRTATLTATLTALRLLYAGRLLTGARGAARPGTRPTIDDAYGRGADEAHQAARDRPHLPHHPPPLPLVWRGRLPARTGWYARAPPTLTLA